MPARKPSTGDLKTCCSGLPLLPGHSLEGARTVSSIADGANLQFETVQLLASVGVKMLIIDEIQHVLAGPTLKQRHFLSVIKYLGNELHIPNVGVGTRDAFNAVQTDPQLANRFEPELLGRWTMSDDYLRLLASFEVALPLTRP